MCNVTTVIPISTIIIENTNEKCVNRMTETHVGMDSEITAFNLGRCWTAKKRIGFNYILH